MINDQAPALGPTYSESWHRECTTVITVTVGPLVIQEVRVNAVCALGPHPGKVREHRPAGGKLVWETAVSPWRSTLVYNTLTIGIDAFPVRHLTGVVA